MVIHNNEEALIYSAFLFSFCPIYLFIYFLLIYKCIISQNGQAHFKNLAKVCLTFLRRYALKNQKQPPEVFLGKVVAKQLY